jgi:ElaB/YqjD/DUF883 family membrane-anchored ribosome-binding protein
MSILIKDKIAVITDCNPFESTPQQRLAEELCRRLLDVGHESYVIKVPVDWHNGDALMQSILSLRLLKVMNADAVVAIDFPAAIVQHHNKYAWITDTTENIARQRFEAALADAQLSEIAEVEQTPHRLTVLQDLLSKIESSYLAESKRLIYCHNALLRSDDMPDSGSESEAEFSNLTNLLKSALSELTADSDVEEPLHLQNLLIPAFEKTDQYLARLPWEPIAKYLTRTLEIE